MGGVDVPVDDFRVGVAEGFGVARCGGGVKLAWGCGVEGCQGGVDGLEYARGVRVSSQGVLLRSDERVRVYCLPDGE